MIKSGDAPFNIRNIYVVVYDTERGYGCWMYLQLPMQSMPLTTDVVGSTPVQGEVCDQVCQWHAADRWYSPSPPVSSTNKTGRHNVTEILLKVALNTIKPKPKPNL